MDELAEVPGPLILGVQLDDGPLRPEPNLVEATLHQRQLPGEGEFDLHGIVAGPAATRGPRAPIGVEVFSDALHALPPAGAAAADGHPRVLGPAPMSGAVVLGERR